MKGLNRVMLIGHLGSDPELKYTPGGTEVANVSLATSENRKDSNGEWKEHTEWHRIVFFGKTAEIAKDYLHKGSRVYIEGRLQTRSWEDRDGQKRYMTEIVGNTLIMLDGSQQAEQASPKKRKDPGPPPDNQPDYDDDLPF